MACPICEKEADAKCRPFCSKRCADIDLGRWFDGTYTTPSDDPDELSEANSVLHKDDPTTH
ncbi:DNA gyrase inhibitor YacG [Cochlodiniinecator piscidefendens]|uniref:DNA gyrase inhibitor YacG n=1 Tax=Cochlodiniinecator piscidefendens TaxID=2715756 RepID=UPI00140C40CF|nr:DNA gyrase inhibitor YacG [Cochlodiniinecator piscidefendens]